MNVGDLLLNDTGMVGETRGVSAIPKHVYRIPLTLILCANTRYKETGVQKASLQNENKSLFTLDRCTVC